MPQLHKLEKHVNTPEQAKELKSLNVGTDSDFVWAWKDSSFGPSQFPTLVDRDDLNCGDVNDEIGPALFLHELDKLDNRTW